MRWERGQGKMGGKIGQREMGMGKNRSKRNGNVEKTGQREMGMGKKTGQREMGMRKNRSKRNGKGAKRCDSRETLSALSLVR